MTDDADGTRAAEATATEGASGTAAEGLGVSDGLEVSSAGVSHAGADSSRPAHLVQRRRSSTTIRYVVIAILVLLAGQVIRQGAMQLYFVPSGSMEPTLCGGPGCGGDDHILVNKLSYKIHDVHRLDIIVFKRPAALDGVTDDKQLVKRVIARGGQSVRWDGAQLWIDGALQHESYVNPACANDPTDWKGSVTLTKDQLFVMGDNRCNSDDSRVFGPISTATVIGKVELIVWPLSRITTL